MHFLRTREDLGANNHPASSEVKIEDCASGSDQKLYSRDSMGSMENVWERSQIRREVKERTVTSTIKSETVDLVRKETIVCAIDEDNSGDSSCRPVTNDHSKDRSEKLSCKLVLDRLIKEKRLTMATSEEQEKFGGQNSRRQETNNSTSSTKRFLLSGLRDVHGACREDVPSSAFHNAEDGTQHDFLSILEEVNWTTDFTARKQKRKRSNQRSDPGTDTEPA
ncbi:hypothetical protein AXG93_1369s1010 [Marchantia polymorpha subsp. ruderalis]|uniref:Uncharacterized protein n=1 Tax=Marchantia polymorpha subsp. ruderalis TaxID=1480154 RepID=A0A176VXB9_MARPO|nr:hypothetical protein AXG93_1369s1010 [Marchantia polymorpha subsp. ruderalis]